MIIDFKLRTYGWQELAMLYAEDITPTSATKRLSNWIQQNSKLQEELAETGWHKGQRVLTPLQVQTIVKYLGEP